MQASQEKLKGAQEELAANRTHQAALENQIKELQASRASLQQELAKLKQTLQQQEQKLKELQKQQVRRGNCSFAHVVCLMAFVVENLLVAHLRHRVRLLWELYCHSLCFHQVLH